jgi:hypothetical protein
MDMNMSIKVLYVSYLSVLCPNVHGKMIVFF